MRKKIFKGTIGIFSFAICFAFLFATMNFMIEITTNVEKLVEDNKIYGNENVKSGNVVINIYSISDRIGVSKDGKKSVYLVETEKNLVILEVDSKDEEISRILDNLPYKKAVKIEESKRNQVIDFISGFNWDENFKAKVDKNIYLSSYSLENEKQKLQIGSYGILIISIVFLCLGIYIVLKNNSNYEKLFDKYGELERDLNLLEIKSDFFNPIMGLAIYKDYLIGFGLTFDFVDLKEIRKIQYILHTTRYGFIKNKKYYFKITDFNGKVTKIFFRKNRKIGYETDNKVDELYDIIEVKFPNIEL